MLRPNTETLNDFWAAMSEAQHLEYACENLKVLLAGCENGQLWNGTANDAEAIFKSYKSNRNLGSSVNKIRKLTGLRDGATLFLEEVAEKRIWLAHDFIREWEGSDLRYIEINRLRSTKLELFEARQKIDKISQILLALAEQK